MLPVRTNLSWLILTLLVALIAPAWLAAQDDPAEYPTDAPLGDVARSLRKKVPPSQNVIDDDNLSKVMEQAENHHPQGSALKFLMAGAGNTFQVSAPDATCSLAFTANVKSLLSNQYAQMELPPAEVQKLEGPATIEGHALIVAIFNRTEWHVSEVAVALTVVKKTQAGDGSLSAFDDFPQESEIRMEKKPDSTAIYRMRAAAPPSETTVFSAPLAAELGAEEEWHWAIVQARGYPPQSYARNAPQIANQRTSLAPTPSPALQASPVSLSQGPQ
jgi:hypothetical protein